MTPPRRTPSSLALVAALVLVLAPLPAAHAALFTASPVDGPSSAIHSLAGLDLALDGGGGLVEVRDDGGSAHVFVARIVGGVWQPVVRVDAGLDAPSSQPVIAAGENGALVVAFINAGRLFAATWAHGATAFSPPALVYGAAVASDPSIGLSVHDKAYIAFTAGGAGGHDVRVAYARLGTPFAVSPAALDVNAADDAGSGTSRPRVAVAGDGVALVVWGESFGVWARRVSGTSPSVAVIQVSPSNFQGHPSGGADSPEVGTGDDDSFALVTFRQFFAQGPAIVSRALARRLRGGSFDDPVTQDGLAFPAGDSAQPARLSIDGLGAGLVAVSLTNSHQTWVSVADNDALPGPPQRLDSDPGASISYAVAARSRDDTGLVAWQRDGGLLAGRSVQVRMFDGTAFAPLATLSNGGLGTTDAVSGIAASGDRLGDLAVAFVQGTAGGRRIVVGGFDRPPSKFHTTTTAAWRHLRRPRLAWAPPTDLWGGATYEVMLDGAAIGTTATNRLLVPSPLSEGLHSWSVIARDRRGQESIANPRTLRVDVTPPTVTARTAGRMRAHQLVRVRVNALDVPPPPPPVAPGALPPPAVRTAGVRLISVDFGDGSEHSHSRSAAHRYAHRGTYTLKITVRDRAGNRTVLKRRLRIRK